MKKPSFPNKRTLGYLAILVVTLAFAIVLGWTSLAAQIDDDAYDVMFRLHPPAAFPAHCIILAIDDATFNSMGGVGGYRAMWTKAFELIKRANPKAAALDVVLSDPWKDPAEDQRLRHAMQAIPNLVLATHLEKRPLGRSAPDLPPACRRNRSRRRRRTFGGRRHPRNSAGRTHRSERHWSLALEAFRLAKGARILESPDDLQIGGEVIPAARSGSIGRPLRVLYTREPIPSVSLKDLSDNPQLAARFQRTGGVHRRDFHFRHL